MRPTIYLLILLLLSACSTENCQLKEESTFKDGKEIQFSDFKTYVEAGEVDHVTHDGHFYKVYLTGNAADEFSRDDDNSKPVFKWLYASPDVWFSMPPGDGYYEDFKSLQETHGFTSKYEHVKEWGQQMISWIIFLVIMLIPILYLITPL